MQPVPGEPMADQNNDDAAFAEMALKMGEVTETQLARGREGLKRVTQAGHKISLADVLVKLGAITPEKHKVICEKLKAAKQNGSKRLGQYTLQRTLGQGAMGAVFLAEDAMMQRQVAIKILPKNLSTDHQFLERFKREAKAAGVLNHVNICSAFAVGEEKGVHYYVMEYCPGESLGEKAKRDKTLPLDDALNIIIQAAEGLGYAHQHGFIHRDIKPDNLLVDDDGSVKILDLGLAKNIDTEDDSAELTQMGKAVGTPHYISPEQAKGEKDIDGRTDIYSLGATLYRIAVGRTPFEAPTAAGIMMKHITEPLTDPKVLKPELPDSVCSVIRRMMSKEPNDRYADCAGLLDDLRRVKDGQDPTPETTRASLGRGRRTTGRHRPIERDGQAVLRSASRRTTGPRAPVGSRAEDDGNEQRPASQRGMLAGVVIAATLLALGVAGWLISDSDKNGRTARNTTKRATGGNGVKKTKVADTQKEEEKEQDASNATKTTDADQKPAAEPSENRASPTTGEPKTPAETTTTTPTPAQPDPTPAPTPTAPAQNVSVPQETPAPATPAVAEKAAPPKEVFLADMKHIETTIPTRYLRYFARRSQKELRMWPPTNGSATATYKLGKRYATFRASVGNRYSNPTATIYFKVLCDGKERWKSQMIKRGRVTERCEVDVTGVERLTIAVFCVGSNAMAYGNWTTPTLVELDARAAAALKAEEEKKAALALAHKEVTQYLGRIRTALSKGNWDDLSSIADAAKADAKLTPLAERVKALTELTDRLSRAHEDELKALKGLTDGKRRTILTSKGALSGVVTGVEKDGIKVTVQSRINNKTMEYTRRVRLTDITPSGLAKLLKTKTPDSPEAWIAEAIKQMAKGDDAASGQALAKAGDHTLSDHIRELSSGGMTKSDGMGAQGGDKPETKPGEVPPVAPLDPDKIPEHLTKIAQSEIQRLFRGRVTQYDQKTLEASVVYDFSDPSQLGDFAVDRGTSGYSGPIIKPDGLRMTCPSSASVLLRQKRFSLRKISVLLRYKDALVTARNHLSVWLGLPRRMPAYVGYSGIRGIVFSGRGDGCGFGRRVPLYGVAWRQAFFKTRQALTTQGDLVVARKGDRLTASLNGKKLVEGPAPTTKLGPGLAIGGGNSLNYTIRQLQISGQLDPVWLDRSRRLLEPITATREDLQKVFKGKVVRFDAKSLQIELTYDFQDAEQQGDWIRNTYPSSQLPKSTLKVADGVFRFVDVEQPVRMKAPLTGVAISAECESKTAIINARLHVNCDARGIGYAITFGKGRCTLEKTQTYRPMVLAERRFPRASAVTRLALSIMYGNGMMKGQAGRLTMTAKEAEYASGHVALSASGAVGFDNVRIRGVLNKKWLIAALDKAKAETPKKTK